MAKNRSKLTVARIFLGILFLIIGVIGLILPILQGWFFLILGASFLGWKIEKKALRKLFKDPEFLRD